jgi:hypothetical protein
MLALTLRERRDNLRTIVATLQKQVEIILLLLREYAFPGTISQPAAQRKSEAQHGFENRFDCGRRALQAQQTRKNSLPRSGWQRWRRCRGERSTTGITVLFDGAQQPTVLHRDYISPSSERIDGSLRSVTPAP